MTALGTIRFRSPAGAKEARSKVRLITERLSGDELLATRLATAMSEIFRRSLAERGEGAYELELGMRGGETELSVCYESATSLPAGAPVRAFFDALSCSRGPAGLYQLRGSKSMGSRAAPSPAQVEELRAVVAREDRETLLSELSVRNQELNESLENLRTTRSAKERMESELNIGREIQMSMLPLEFPPFPDRKEFEIYATLVPAREVGGDFYDFFFVDPTWLCVCVGDVSGKGVPSALFAAVTKTLIKSLAKSTPSPSAVLTQVNGELAEGNDSCMFVTVLLALLNVATGELVYCNAGHNPPLIRREAGAVEVLDARHGPVVAAMEGLAYREDRTRLEPGELFLLYTDGVTEALNAAQELFSDARLERHVRGLQATDAHAAVDATLTAVRGFEAGAEQADDITLLAVEFFGPLRGEAAASFEHILTNDLGQISALLDAFEAFVDEHGVPLKFSRKFLMALDDLVNNVISYGFEDDGEHEIRVGAHKSGQSLSVVIEDDGRPFNPLQRSRPDVNASLEDREIGGLGIHLVRELLDDISYERRGARNVLTLTTHLSADSG
jgi:sigma-B regulation protein RsbU (phosphoserine phosphatase)